MKKFLAILSLLFICGCEKKESLIFNIELKNKIVDGYSWHYEILDKSIIKQKEGFTFEALKNGKTSIIFSYTNDKDILYDARFDIEIDENIKIINKLGNYFALEEIWKSEAILNLTGSLDNYELIFDRDLINYEDNDYYSFHIFINLDKRKYKVNDYIISSDLNRIYINNNNSYELLN